MKLFSLRFTVSTTLHLHCSSFNDTPLSQNRLPLSQILETEVGRASETMVTIYNATCFHKPEDQNTNVHCRKHIRTHLIQVPSKTCKPN